MIARLRELGRRYRWPNRVAIVLRDAAWISAGSVLGAVGTLLGLRLITEMVPPEIFGPFVLANGMLALASGIALQPIAQAALRFYPDLELRGRAGELRHVMAATMTRRIFFAVFLAIVLALVDRTAAGWFSTSTWVLLMATLIVDAIRTIEVVLRNAAGDQIGYAALGAFDAWMRPVAAAAAAFFAGASVETLLLGQFLGGAIVAVLFTKSCPRPAVARRSSWREKLQRYGAPLAWAPVFGWLLSLADRYVVAALLGSAAAGVYAAAYGLVSRPMLMLGGIADASLRQRLYAAVSRGDARSRRRVEGAWLAANVLLGLCIAGLFGVCGAWIVEVAVAAEYRAATLRLLLPIALGHVAILAYQAAVRHLYADGLTGRVLLADGAAAVLAVSGAVVGAIVGGVPGVAWAMPVYGCMQLGLTLALARRST